MEKEEEKKENIQKKASTESNDLKEKLKSGPFAKLKKYNQPAPKKDEASQPAPKTENIQKNKNRFLYMGKILNYSFIEKINKKPKINSILFSGSNSIYSSMFDKEHSLQMNVLNYSEYKKKMKRENK